jgi:hypothetical protein
MSGREEKLKAVRTIAKTSDNSPHNQVSQAESSALQDGANDHDTRTQEDHLPSTEEITNEDGYNSADETANIVTSN